MFLASLSDTMSHFLRIELVAYVDGPHGGIALESYRADVLRLFQSLRDRSHAALSIVPSPPREAFNRQRSGRLLLGYLPARMV
jgi:hypothetical protein